MACKECGSALTPGEARRLGLNNVEFHIRKHHSATCSHYVGASHPSGVTPTTHAARVAGGDARASAAIEHLLAAHEALNAACRDLCSVIGATNHYREIGRLSDKVRGIVHDINLDYARDAQPYRLSYTPSDEEIERKHNCSLEATAEAAS